MEKKILFDDAFKNELIKMAISCIGNKENTAKKKHMKYLININH